MTPGTPQRDLSRPADNGGLVDLGGLADPLAAVPARAPGSVRRTMNVDVGPRTEYQSRLAMWGAARDLRTGPGGPGDTEVLAEASVTADFDNERSLISLATTPEVPWSPQLVGARAGGGFRRHLDAVVPSSEKGSLLRQVLDDMPAGALISGYAWLRMARRAGANPADTVPANALEHMTDMCSGWRSGGVATVSIAAGKGVPVQMCPPAPRLDGEDALAWHDMGVLAENWMRRRRLIDVTVSADERFFIFAMFRDTVGDAEGEESVLHEYAVRAVGSAGVITALEAEPRVLPFPECPAAAGEVSAMAGTELAAFAAAVPDTLVGIASCTHLNDLLRALGGVDALVAAASGA